MFLTKDNKLKWNWIAVGAIVTGGLVWGLYGAWDKEIYFWARNLSCNFWLLFGEVFSWKIWILVTAGVFGVFCAKRIVKTIVEHKNERKQFKLLAVLQENWQKTKRSHAFLIFCSVFCACGVVALLKPLIARLRPVLEVTQQIPEFNRFSWNWNSMPSGHTTVSFAGLVMIGMLAPRFKPLTWTLAILIGASRVIEGDHYLSDVILGAFIGMLVADVVKWWWLRKSK